MTRWNHHKRWNHKRERQNLNFEIFNKKTKKMMDFQSNFNRKQRINELKKLKSGKNEVEFWDSCSLEILTFHDKLQHSMVASSNESSNRDTSLAVERINRMDEMEQFHIILTILLESPISLKLVQKLDWNEILLNNLKSISSSNNSIKDPMVQDFFKLLISFSKKVGFGPIFINGGFKPCLEMLMISRDSTLAILVGKMLQKCINRVFEILIPKDGVHGQLDRNGDDPMLQLLLEKIVLDASILPVLLVGVLQASSETLAITLGTSLAIIDLLLDPFSCEGLYRYFFLLPNTLVKQLYSREIFHSILLLILAKWEDPRLPARNLKDLVTVIANLLTKNGLLWPVVLLIANSSSCKGKYEILTILISKLEIVESHNDILYIVNDCLEQQEMNFALGAVNVIVACCKITKGSMLSIPLANYFCSEKHSKMGVDYLLQEIGQNQALLAGILEIIVNNKVGYNSLLAVLRACKKIGHDVDDYNNHVAEALESQDFETRLNAFLYLTDSRKNIQSIDNAQLQFVMTFLETNVNETIANRQLAVANVGKLFLRLKRFVYKLGKDKEKLQLKSLHTKQDLSIDIDAIGEEMRAKQKMFGEIVDFAVKGLFPGSTMNRSSYSILLLKKIIEIENSEIDSTASINLEPLFVLTTSQSEIIYNRAIFETIHPNRVALLEIIGHNIHNIEFLIEPFKKLLNSCRAADVAISQSVARILLISAQNGKEINLVQCPTQSGSTSESRFLSQLVYILQEKVNAAKNSGGNSGKHSPLNVLLAAITYN